MRFFLEQNATLHMLFVEPEMEQNAFYCILKSQSPLKMRFFTAAMSDQVHVLGGLAGIFGTATC